MTEGRSGAGFDIDLRNGQAREDALVYVFLRALVEVKSDRKARETGNVFVEYRQPSGLSGIATTTAQWWAFEIDDDVWILVPTEKLRALARVAWRDPRRRKKGGDFNNYDGVLVPVAWLVKPRLRVT